MATFLGLDGITWLFIAFSLGSLIEYLAVYNETRKMRAIIEFYKNMIKQEMVSALKDPETKKAIQLLVLDQEFFEGIAKMVFENLKSGIYGLLGIDRKQEKGLMEALKDGALEEKGGAFGQLLGALPKKGREYLEKNPESMKILFRFLQGPAPGLGRSTSDQGPAPDIPTVGDRM